MPRNENTHMLENSLTTRQENRKKEAPFHVQKTKNTFFFFWYQYLQHTSSYQTWPGKGK